MDHTHCKYLSKPCANVRSLKDDGALHRFCTFHRNKANDAQRRWHARQRRDPGMSCPSVTSKRNSSSDESDTSTKKRRRVDAYESRRLDTTSPIGIDAAGALDTALTPFMSIAGEIDKGFATDELMHLDDFLLALDEFVGEDAQYIPDTPEACFALEPLEASLLLRQ